MCTYLDVDFPRNRQGLSLKTSQHLRDAYGSMNYRYSDLLKTLISVMLSSSHDRPLPSQIYQIFGPFKNDIMSFRPFNFSVNSMYNSISQSRANPSNGMISAYLGNSIPQPYNQQYSISPHPRSNSIYQQQQTPMY